MPFLTGHLWKVATGGAALIALILTFFLVSSQIENRQIGRQRDALSAQINNPKTGYVAQLAQAHTNVETLRVQVQRQNAAYEKLSEESRKRLQFTEIQLAAAQAETQIMERKLAGFLATKPRGATLEDRVRDIDERAMSEFMP